MTDTCNRSSTAGELLIDGQWRQAVSGETIDVLNPATGQSIGHAAIGGVDDIALAVAAARRSFEDGRWRFMAPAARAKIMFRIADLIDEEAEQIAVAEVAENGMTIGLGRGCARGAAEVFRYFGGWVTKINGLTTQISNPAEFHCYTLREPIGVAGLIVPWNGPIYSASQKVAAALAAGCSAVLKPSENTPLNTLRLGRICGAAGIPDGVFNIVNGYGDTAGAALIHHPDVDKLSFTGSTAVGRKLIAASAGNLKRLTLELGGKSPVIVFDDADLDQALAGVRAGIFTNSGQQCIAGSRAYIQRGIYDRLLERLAGVASGLKVGNGMDPEVQIGPLISQRQLDRVMGYIDSGAADGARVVTGGHRVGKAGYFVAPTILAEIDQRSAAMREEIFGPVLCAVPFDDPEDALRLANDTTYGLAGAVYTRDISKAHKFAKRLSAGNVYINCHGIMDFAMPFGGYRASGWQRQSGEEGLGAFLETKSVFALL